MILTTERLILRPFEESDFEEVQKYAGNYENLIYTIWGPNTEDETKEFLKQTKKLSIEDPCQNYQFAVVLKHNNCLIGGFMAVFNIILWHDTIIDNSFL